MLMLNLARTAARAGVVSLLMAHTANAQSTTAQSTRLDQLAPHCPAGSAPLIDTTQVIVGLSPSHGFRDSVYSDAQRQQIMFYADAIQRYFTTPTSLGGIPTLVHIPVFADDVGDDGSLSVLGGRLILIVKRNGRLRTLAWEYFPISTPLANAVVRATQAADSAGEFDGILRPYDVSSDDTLAVDIRSFLETEPVQFPLMRARLASYRNETLAAVLKQGRMVYPRSAQLARVGTQGEVRFIVGSDGHVVESFTQITKSGWRDFFEPMRRAVSATTYIPAQSGGCAVPALVRQKFTYEITK